MKASFDGDDIRMMQRFVLKCYEFFFNCVNTIHKMVLYVVFQIFSIFNIDFPHIVFRFHPKISVEVREKVGISTIGV